MLVIQRERGNGTPENPVHVWFWSKKRDMFIPWGGEDDTVSLYRRVVKRTFFQASQHCVPGDRIVILDTARKPRANDHFHVNNEPCTDCDLHFIDARCFLTNARRERERNSK